MNMNELTTICKDGTDLEDRNCNVGGFALHSLKLGIRAYFSTYKEVRCGIHIFHNNSDNKIKDLNTSDEFFECSAETILHFHHFVELIFKDILRSIHPLMADGVSNDPVVLKKILEKKPLSDSEKARLKSIGFREALKRLVILIKKREIENYGYYQFIVENENKMLERLNFLRNRIWHRGKFILRYDSLDKFVCQYFLPFLREILELDKYRGYEINWKYKPLKIEFDPLDFLYSERDNYDVGKFSLAKELGRAAYENQLDDDKSFGNFYNEDLKQKSERTAETEVMNVSRIEECPVCGVKSLIVYEDIDIHGENTDSQVLRSTYKVKCTCCTFEIYDELKNIKNYGIPITDYWITENF